VSNFDRLSHVTLACGCVVRLRAKPMNPNSKFLCRSGQGHSYNQPWMFYKDGDRVFENPQQTSRV
jgi:hypothetical protein